MLCSIDVISDQIELEGWHECIKAQQINTTQKEKNKRDIVYFMGKFNSLRYTIRERLWRD